MVNPFKTIATSVEVVKEMGNGFKGRRHSGAVEAGPKAIRPRASVNVHAFDGKQELLFGERFVNVTKSRDRALVDVTDRKVPKCRATDSQKVVVEIKEDIRFLVMSRERDTIAHQGLDFVATHPVGSTGMEVPAVFVALKGVPLFTTLLQKNGFFLNRPHQNIGDNAPERKFMGEKITALLNVIQQFQDNFAILFMLRPGP